MFARSIVLSKNEKEGIKSFDIDMCKTIHVPTNQVFQMPEQCYKRPALGGLSKSIGKMDTTQTKCIKSLIEKQGTLKVKVNRMIPKKKGTAASVECDVIGENGKPLAKYILNSWTSCIPEIPKALGKYIFCACRDNCYLEKVGRCLDVYLIFEIFLFT